MPAFLVVGDVQEALPQIPDGTFDALLSDPPYGISFMGKAWDHGVPSADVWREAVRVLKPGAAVLAFGGTRMFHRLAVAMEDGGVEIRDCLSWLYGSGMPKSLDIGAAVDKAVGGVRPRDRKPAAPRSAIMGDRPWLEDPDHKFLSRDPVTPDGVRWNGYGTALKPSWEPIILGQTPMPGTYAESALERGVAGLNIDGSRVGSELMPRTTSFGVPISGNASMNGKNYERHRCAPITGRWPANVLIDEEAAAALDAQAGELRSGPRRAGSYNQSGYKGGLDPQEAEEIETDRGGASRFFYCAKASQAEKHLGCEDFRWRRDGERLELISEAEYETLPMQGRAKGNAHPTVKPLDLIRYLAKLILPPPRADGRPRRVFVPYAGSGSEMIACLQAGWDEAYGVELDPAHGLIVGARFAVRGLPLTSEVIA